MRLGLLSVIVGAVLLNAGAAFAQEPLPPLPSAPPANHERRATPPGGYPAPLSQTTQPSYVPQSVALSGPSEIKTYNEGDPVPPGYQPVQRVRKGFVITGAILFGGFYLFSSLAASIDADKSDPELQALWVPGIGPFIQMASTDNASGKYLLAIDGLAQSAGIFMLVYGLVSPKTVLVRNDLAKTDVRVLPMTGMGTTGLQLAGTF